MKAVEIKNLSFTYENGKNQVIKNLSLSVDKGEFLCVLGENGSGKSTLSRLINGLLQPNSGEVKVFGLDTTDKASAYEIRKKVGMVFQNPDNQMVATMVEDDIAFGPENIGVPSNEIGERIDFALNAVGMQEFRKSSPERLSGGQKQRIAIASVLALKPEILILDESTAMLDPKGRKEVLAVVKKLNKEQAVTVIAITHYMEEVVDADKVIVLNDGEIYAQGTPREIFLKGDELKGVGLELPTASYIAQKIKKAGVQIPDGILTDIELAEALCKL